MKRTARLSLLIPAIVVSSALLASSALMAVPRWEPVGPFGHDGYRIFPTGDPAILYVTSFYAGLYRSDDRGQSWRQRSPVAGRRCSPTASGGRCRSPARAGSMGCGEPTRHGGDQNG